MSVGTALKGFFGLVWRILEGIRKVLHLVVLLLIFGFVLAALHTSVPIVPRSAALVVAPQGELVEQLSGDPVRRALGEASGGPAPETLLRDVIEAISAAKSDARIKLIVLNLDQLEPSGLSKLQEVGAAIRDFRSSGKRVVATGDSLNQSQYYLAAQAGEVYLDPMGEVSINGFSYYRMYYKDAIDKLGVDFNVFRAGTFKSYTDQFSRSDMAASEREETSVWLESLWNAYTQDVTRARSLPPGALKDFIEGQPASLPAVNGDMAKMALQRGLVTALKSRRQVADDLKGLVGEDEDNHSFNAVGINQYLAAIRSKRVLKSKSDAKVGVVVASGEIFDGRQMPGAIGGESTSELLRQARYDNAVKSVVLRVDSPGRQRVCVGKNPARGVGLAQGGQTRRRFHEHLRSVGRLLHRGGRKSDLRQPDHHYRFHRRVFIHTNLPTHPGETRHQGRRHRHLAARRRIALGSAAGARDQANSASLGRSRLCAVPAARRRRQEEIGGGRGQDCPRPGLGRRRCTADRSGGSPGRTEGGHGFGGEVGRAGYRLRGGIHRARNESARGIADADPLGNRAAGSIGRVDTAAQRCGADARSAARTSPRHRKAQRSSRSVFVLLVPRTVGIAQVTHCGTDLQACPIQGDFSGFAGIHDLESLRGSR